MVELVLVVRGPEVLARQFEPVGSQKPVIMPPALLASRQSTIGGKFVAAEILVDAPEVVLDSLVVDMSAANVTGCAPAVAGVYVRDASGSLTNLEISGAHATTTPDCDTRVGPPHRGGTIGDIFGQPLLGKAVVSLSNSSFTNNQKGGVVVLGNRAIVKIKDSQALGDGIAALGVQNGIELSGGVKARVQDVQVRHSQTTVAGKTATGLLLMGAHKARIRRATITDVQSGVFDVGDGTRVLDRQLRDITSDASSSSARRTGRSATSSTCRACRASSSTATATPSAAATCRTCRSAYGSSPAITTSRRAFSSPTCPSAWATFVT
jgi:hypothetical protein